MTIWKIRLSAEAVVQVFDDRGEFIRFRFIR